MPGWRRWIWPVAFAAAWQLMTGCATGGAEFGAGDYIIDAAHGPDFRPYPNAFATWDGDLVAVDHEAGVRVVLRTIPTHRVPAWCPQASQAARDAAGPRAVTTGCVLPPWSWADGYLIISNGSRSVNAHEFGHLCDYEGWRTCTRIVEALRRVAR